MEKNIDDVIKENMVKMFVKPAGSKIKIEVKIDERTFVDKKFETKLLKNFFGKYEKLFKRAKKLERKHWIIVSYITDKYSFHGLDVYIGLRVDELLISFSFEVGNSEKDIYIECMMEDNEFIFEWKYLDEDKYTDLKDNLNRLKEIIKKEK